MVDRKTIDDILKVYGESWTDQDPDKILTIFTEDAIYLERAFDEEGQYYGHQQIQDYWVSKVVGEQYDIKFKVLNVYIDGNTAIAEWEAELSSRVKNKRIRMRETAILEMQGDKIKSLREYWQSEKLYDILEAKSSPALPSCPVLPQS